VVANARLVPPRRDTASLDMAAWDRVFAANVRRVAATLKRAAPVLPTGGSMIVMCSINSLRAAPYTASKHAALGIVLRCDLWWSGCSHRHWTDRTVGDEFQRVIR
jgi:NAD(P)-dependent dehydrogenase (short-subunit alcohol dehydrogenase family)